MTTPKKVPVLLCWAVIAAGLIAFSQTAAFAWDEGFHLLAAQLIAAGRKPYLDFVFAQTPLNAYWNAAAMRVLGESWRIPHFFAAIETTAALILAADFLRARFRVPNWTTASVITALVLAGSNGVIVEFGTVAQAYGICLLLIVAAFRTAVLSVERGSLLFASAAGLLAAAAAESSLLTASVAPVLLLWMWIYAERRRRWTSALSFAAGAAVALIPLAVLFLQSPRRVIFDVFDYHLFFRRSEWPGATQHDLEVFASWIDFPQAIILMVLAAAGIWFIVRRSTWDRAQRAEFYLCAWLAAALALHISTAHPTFERYYLFTVPFLAILAAVGLFAIASKLGLERASWPVFAVGLLVCLGLGKRIYERDYLTWHDMEQIAAQVEKVTPAGAPFYAEEHIYFLTRRTPPPGNEYLSSHKLRLPPEQSQLLHIVPQTEFDRRIQAGEFHTLEACQNDEWINERKLNEIYKQKMEIAGCSVFWDLAASQKLNAARLP